MYLSVPNCKDMMQEGQGRKKFLKIQKSKGLFYVKL